MAKSELPGRRPNHDRKKYDDFRETLAVPGRTYRSEITSATDDHASAAEKLIRYGATVLGILLVLRFVASLLTANVANPLVNFLHISTNWIVNPFQGLFGSPNTSSGFIDWPAVAALVAVTAIATLLISLMRPRDSF